jgi:hypothetical protein
MPVTLEGSCRCGAVSFTLDSHTPVPYQLCYCTICRKTAGGGGYAINIMGNAETLVVKGETATYRAKLHSDDGKTKTSSGRRHFCPSCGSALWMADPSWPDLVHPFASAIDTPLPVAKEKVHLMLKFKASWVEPSIGPKDASFDEYPTESIEDWHRKRAL